MGTEVLFVTQQLAAMVAELAAAGAKVYSGPDTDTIRVTWDDDRAAEVTRVMLAAYDAGRVLPLRGDLRPPETTAHRMFGRE
jgi:hypothetical protein